jgi:hypothetical protein
LESLKKQAFRDLTVGCPSGRNSLSVDGRTGVEGACLLGCNSTGYHTKTQNNFFNFHQFRRFIKTVIQ